MRFIKNLKIIKRSSLSKIIFSKRDLRSNLKELNRLKKLMCGEVTCYIKTKQISKTSTKIQLCSTFMDTSEYNQDLNDFLGTAINKEILRIDFFLFNRNKEFQPRSFM